MGVPMANNVLVTGGAGYIGSHACKALAAAGYTPVTLDNLVYGHRAAVRWGPFVEGDVGDPQLVRDVLRTHAIEAVMHFAGYAYVGESMHEPGKYFRNNFANTVTLLDAMRAENVQSIVFSSTCDVRRSDCIADRRGPSAAAGESLRRVEAFRRASARLVQRGARDALCGAALFQRRRRGCRWRAKPARITIPKRI